MALFLGIAAFGAAVPRVLIIQIKAPMLKDVDPNLPIANLIASEFDEIGKLEAVVWSLTDPIFRAATTAGKVKSKDDPTLQDAMGATRGLAAEYIFVAQAFSEGKAYRGKGELFKGGKSIWKDDQNITVQNLSASDADGSLRSLARTLIMRLDNQALKGMESTKVAPTPDLVKGQAPPVVVVEPPKPEKKDNSSLLRGVNELLNSGKSSAAIVLLRDAVDSDPLDIELRIALASSLMVTDPMAAALEARNAATLLPENADLRILAARAWMKAGRPEEAQADLNEAVARNPEGVSTRLLLGEVGVSQLKPERALEHLTKAIEAADSAEERYLRALAYALSGSAEPMRADMDEFAKLDPSPSALDIKRRYSFACDLLDRALQLDGNEVRALIQRAIVKPDDKVVLNAVESQRRLVRARAAFAERAPLAPGFKQVHEQRLLAYKLMAQSLTDLLGYMAGGGDDALTDARINLGESLKNASEARTSETKLRAAG